MHENGMKGYKKVGGIKEIEAKHADTSPSMGSFTKIYSKGSPTNAQSEKWASKDQEILALKAQIELLKKEKEQTAPKHSKNRKEM